MGTPILLVVDEDRAVLEALSGDLGRRFGIDHQVLAEPSPARGSGRLPSSRRRPSRSPWCSPASR